MVVGDGDATGVGEGPPPAENRSAPVPSETMATAAIVNDGRLMVPYLVDRTVSADGELVDR